MTFDQLRDALYDWMDANTSGLQGIVWRNQNPPRLAVPFIDAEVTPSNKIGHDFISRPEDLQDARHEGNREVTLNIQHFGPGGYSRLETLRASLETTAGREKLTEAGIAFVDDEGIVNVSELLDTRYEQRYSLDLIFRYAYTGTTATGQIDTVKIDETVKHPNGTNVVSETVEIP